MQRSNSFKPLVAAALLASAFAVQASAVVPGTSDPWLAGMPNGSTASFGDVAPDQSPVLYTGIALVSGTWLTFNVSVDAAAGLVGNCPGCTVPTPDGAGIYSHASGSENGIADVSAPLNSLVGVFLDGSQPDSTAAPAGLDFSASGLGTDFASVAPGLKQVFFIGDGLTSGSAVQQFQVPVGATRLYLGTMDGYGWYNNVGAYDVTASVVAVPEPESYALLLAGLGMVGFMVRGRRAR